MHYWLMKTEPSTFSFDDLVRDKRTKWDGVRNFQARNNMKAMKKGDHVLIYHSVVGKACVGIAEVSKEHYPEPTKGPEGRSKKSDWVLVDLIPVKALKKPVTLEDIKAKPALKEIKLIRQSRLSVMPLTKAEFETIVKMGS